MADALLATCNLGKGSNLKDGNYSTQRWHRPAEQWEISVKIGPLFKEISQAPFRQAPPLIRPNLNYLIFVH